MKIIIDKSKCIGCLLCKKTCYSVFEVGEDGKVKVRPGVTEADILDAKRAEINCPVGAIKIIDDEKTDDESVLDKVNSIFDWLNSDK